MKNKLTLDKTENDELSKALASVSPGDTVEFDRVVATLDEQTDSSATFSIVEAEVVDESTTASVGEEAPEMGELEPTAIAFGESGGGY